MKIDAADFVDDDDTRPLRCTTRLGACEERLERPLLTGKRDDLGRNIGIDRFRWLGGLDAQARHQAEPERSRNHEAPAAEVSAAAKSVPILRHATHTSYIDISL